MENKLIVYKPKKNIKKIILRIFLGILVSFLIFIIAAYAGAFIFIKSKWDKTNYVDLQTTDITINPNISKDLSDYTNIALLGVDSRADEYTNCRSDGIMIISINNKTHNIKICSVYRDTYLDIEGYGLDKVTHAYAFGNAKLTLNTLNRNLDLNITKFATVNFETLKKVVDNVGGVNIHISAEEANFISGIDYAGFHTLNGEQALQYCRIRKLSGGDYVRTERMRNVLISVFDKAKNRNISELNEMADLILPDVYTNISAYEVFNMIPKIATYNVVNNSAWPVNVKSRKMNGVWYEIPDNLEKQVGLLHSYLFDDNNYIASDVVKEINSKLP